MKRIVTDRFAGSFLHPGVESRSQGLAFVLDRKINQSRSPTESCRPSTGLKIIRARGSAERHVEMGMNVNAARKHKLSRGIDNLSSILARKTLSDCSDLALANSNVARIRVRGRNYTAIGDDG